MNRRWLGVALLLLARCASHSLEVGRPLVVAAIPTEGKRLEQIVKHFPGVPAARVAESMAHSRSARNLFDIHKHNEWTSFVPVGRLVRAIDLVRDNPFAWVQLGAYLALNHQTGAAIMATTRGIEAVEEKCAVRPCTTDLRRLHSTALINLAIYTTDAERPLSALVALERVDPWDLTPFEQLAYHWTAVNTRSALGDVEGARRALFESTLVREEDLGEPPTLKRDYPQFFGTQREAMQTYLEAVIDMAAKDYACAEEKARKAVQLDAHLWDAHLLLSAVQYARGDYGGCIDTLEPLAKAKRRSVNVFRPERLAYNAGNAYLARFEKNKERIEDLQKAREWLATAARDVELRFEKEQDQTRLAGIFDLSRNDEDARSSLSIDSETREPAEVGRFFLDALATTSPIYADACNNLGTVYDRLATAAGDTPERHIHLANAEEAWRRALRDQYWPRRHLAYGNLASFYARTDRLSAAAEAADAALRVDPFNVVPLRALLGLLETRSGSAEAVEAAHIAGRLIAQRRQQYPGGLVAEFLSPYEKRLRELSPSDPVRQTLHVLAYAGAAGKDTERIARLAHAEFPEWKWPAVLIARIEVAAGETAGAWKLVEGVEHRDVPLQDWLAKREQADVHLLRAQLRAGMEKYPGARRDIERALAAGIDETAAGELSMQVEKKLLEAGLPPVTSLAVLPFDTIYSEERNRLGHSIASSLSGILRGTVSGTVRSLERDAVDVADWNPHSAIEVGRMSGIGAVLSGRYAQSRNLVVIDVRVFDSVSGQELFARAYETPQAGLLKKQAQIVRDVLERLRLQPNKPVDQVIEGFSARPNAYAAYLAGADILLSGRPPGAKGLQRAKALFDFARRRDSGFARADAALAHTLYRLANLYADPLEVMPAAEKAVKRAVSRTPRSAETQLANALVRTWYRWDLKSGKAAFDEALDLDPCNSTIHRLRGDYFAALGAFEHAFAEKRKALELSPLSAVATVEAGQVLFFQREWQAALKQADAALTLSPGLATAYELKAWVYTKQGRYKEALEALDAAARRSDGETPLQLAHRGVAYALNGERIRANLVLAELHERVQAKPYVLPLLEARVHAAKGDSTAALKGLWEAAKHKSESIVWLGVDPWFDSLRDKASFQRLLQEVDRSGGKALISLTTASSGPCHVSSAAVRTSDDVWTEEEQ